METSWTILEMYVTIFGLIVTVGILGDKKGKGATQQLLDNTRARLRGCASRFNQQVKSLQKEYKAEKIHGKKSLKTYEAKYNITKSDYDREANEIVKEWHNAKKDNQWWARYWKVVIVTGVICLLGACSEALVSLEEKDEQKQAPTEQIIKAHEERVWNAKTIPMPHLTDGRRYVSNPDSIVSEETVRRLDAQLKKMDDSLGIESVLAIVSRVENGDIFRFAQDIFDIYKVGKNDRGLVMVLAYDDHKFRSHTGRSLEADLTDAEAFRFQERYLIPSMKAEMPDSGLIYYTEAIYNLLQGKELPVMTGLNSNANSDDDTDDVLPAIYFFLLAAWLGVYLFASHRHGWNMKSYYGGMLTKNPFVNNGSALAAGYVAGSILNGGGRSRGGGFGGGFGGGSFGGGFSGGSSGGGGATSSW